MKSLKVLAALTLAGTLLSGAAVVKADDTKQGDLPFTPVDNGATEKLVDGNGTQFDWDGKNKPEDVTRDQLDPRGKTPNKTNPGKHVDVPGDGKNGQNPTKKVEDPAKKDQTVKPTAKALPKTSAVK